MSEPRKSGAEWLADVAERMQKEKEGGALPTTEILTIRELIRKFGYMQRGRIVVGEIRNALQDNDLIIMPDSFDIEYAYSLAEITINELDSTVSDEKSKQPTVRIDSLEAAHKPPVSVKPDHPLEKATTIMQYRNYSQLPVMVNDRDIKGVISWRSIGEAYAHGCNPSTVKDCMEKEHVVEATMTLSDAASEIYRHDYILVRGHDKKITGIVTAADIALQFRQLAYPFLLIGEIEAHLRSIIHRKFTVEELRDIAKSEKDIYGPDDLTFGDYVELFSSQEKWNIVELPFDRKEFVLQLDKIRTIRNNIVHFSVDEPDEDDEPDEKDNDTEQLEGMVTLLRKWRAHSG